MGLSVGPCADSVEPYCDSLSPPLSAPLLIACSLKVNKLKQNFFKSHLTFNCLQGWGVTVWSPVPCVLIVGATTVAGGITCPRLALSTKDVKHVHKGCAYTRQTYTMSFIF